MKLLPAFAILLIGASGLQGATPTIQSLGLVNGSTGAATPFGDGSVIDLAKGLRWSVRANANGAESIAFQLDNAARTIDNTERFESVPGAPALGNHSIRVTPYSKTDGRGSSGRTISVPFKVIKTTASPTPTPRPSPIATPTPSPTTPPTTPSATPPSPSPTVAPSPSFATAVVSWDQSTGADGYWLYYGAASRNYATRVLATVPTVNVPGLIVGTNYFFAVSAFNSSGESAKSAEVQFRPMRPGLQKLEIKR